MHLAQFRAACRLEHGKMGARSRHGLPVDEMAQRIGQPAERGQRGIAAIGRDGVHADLQAAGILNTLSSLAPACACGNKDNMLNCFRPWRAKRMR